MAEYIPDNVTFRCLPACLPLAADNSPCRSLIWYLALDVLKWFLMWALNEEGVRSKAAWKKFLRSKERPAIKTGERSHLVAGVTVSHASVRGAACHAGPGKATAKLQIDDAGDGVAA